MSGKDYSEPVVCGTPADIRVVAEEMKSYCRGDFHDKKPQYCKHEQEAYDLAADPEFAEFVKNSPGVRLLYLRDLMPVTVGLTLDLWKNPVAWNLSMSVPRPPGGKIMRVPDPVAGLVAVCFLGAGFTEIPPEGSIPEIRQFIKAIDAVPLEVPSGEGDNRPARQ